MALQYVGGKTGTWAGSTTIGGSISLTALTGGIASAAKAGDIVIAVYATGATTARTLTIDSIGYTTVAALNSSNTYDTNLLVAYKVLTAADATVDFGAPGAAGDGGAAAVHVWRGSFAVSPLSGVAQTATSVSTARPDPPAMTPTDTGAVILVAGGGGALTGSVFTSGLSNFITAVSIETYDGIVGLGAYTGWTSGTYDPAAWAGGSSVSSSSWAAVTLALQPIPPKTLSPPRFNNSSAFSAPTVVATEPLVDLAPPLVSNAQTFYGHDMAPGPVSLAPPPIDSTAGIYAPFMVLPAITLEPGRLDNGQAFYGATVGPGPVVLAPGPLATIQGFYAPSVSSGSVRLQPGLLSGAQAFYGAAVGAGPVALVPPLVSNAQAFYPSTVASSALALRPPRLDNGPALYAPSVSAGGVSLQPSLLVGVQNFFASAVTPSGRALLPDQIVNAQAFFAPVVLAGSVSIAPTRHANSQQFPAASVTPGAVALSPSLLAQMQQFYAPTVRARLDIRFGMVAVRVLVDQVELSAHAEPAQAQVTVDAVMARVETMQ